MKFLMGQRKVQGNRMSINMRFLLSHFLLFIFWIPAAHAEDFTVSLYPFLPDSASHWFPMPEEGRSPGLFEDRRDARQRHWKPEDSEEYPQRLQQLKSALQVEHEPYAPTRIQNLIAIADIHKRSGNAQEEIRVLEEVLHVSRVNVGLYHKDHVAILKRLINAAITAGNDTQAQDYHLALLNMRQKIHSMDHPELAKAWLDWADWHLDAWFARSRPIPGLAMGPMHRLPDVHAVESVASYQKAIELIHANDGMKPHHGSLLRESIKKLQLLKLNFSTLNPAVQPGVHLHQMDQLSHGAAMTPMPGLYIDFGGMHSRITKEKKVRSGGPALEVIHLVEEADWQMLQGNHKRARQLQEKAATRISQCGEICEPLKDLITPGIPVPDPEEWLYFLGHDLVFRGYVEVMVDISPSGYATKVEFLESRFAGREMEQLVVQKARHLRYRPPQFPEAVLEGVKLRLYFE